MIRLQSMTAIEAIWGHSSVGRAPAWHEAIKSINKAWYKLIFGSNITKFGAKLGALLNNQIFMMSRFIKIILAS